METIQPCARAWIPASLRLAMTAGAEHYTAVLGAGAIEEYEHNAVAFDVLRATHPSYRLRIPGFLIATAALFGWSFAGTRMLITQDRVSRAVFREHRRRALERDDHRGIRRIRSGVRACFRRDLHLDESDHLALARQRLAELIPAFTSA